MHHQIVVEAHAKLMYIHNTWEHKVCMTYIYYKELQVCTGGNVLSTSIFCASSWKGGLEHHNIECAWKENRIAVHL